MGTLFMVNGRQNTVHQKAGQILFIAPVLAGRRDSLQSTAEDDFE
jgi:hypothetical protein